MMAKVGVRQRVLDSGLRQCIIRIFSQGGISQQKGCVEQFMDEDNNMSIGGGVHLN
jgi:hypothetical protein